MWRLFVFFFFFFPKKSKKKSLSQIFYIINDDDNEKDVLESFGSHRKLERRRGFGAGGCFIHLVSSRHFALLFLSSVVLGEFPLLSFFQKSLSSLSLCKRFFIFFFFSRRRLTRCVLSLSISVSMSFSLRRNWRRTSRRRKMALDTWTFCSKDERDVCERFCPCPPKAPQHPRRFRKR